MENKKLIYLAILLIALLTISGVSASEISDDVGLNEVSASEISDDVGLNEVSVSESDDIELNKNTLTIGDEKIDNINQESADFQSDENVSFIGDDSSDMAMDNIGENSIHKNNQLSSSQSPQILQGYVYNTTLFNISVDYLNKSKLGENVKVSVSAFYSDGKPLYGRVIFNGTSYYLSSGLAQFTINTTELGINKYAFSIYYERNAGYSMLTISDAINITTTSPLTFKWKTIYTGIGYALCAVNYDFIDLLGNSIPFNGDLTIKLGNKVTHSFDGTRVPKKPGTYTYNLIFQPENKYYDKVSAAFKVICKDTPKISLKYSVLSYSKVKLVAYFKNYKNEYIKKGGVTFRIGEKTYSRSVKKGKASIIVTIPKNKKSIACTVFFGEDNYFLSEKRTITFKRLNDYKSKYRTSKSSSKKKTKKKKKTKVKISTFKINSNYYDGGKYIYNDHIMVHYTAKMGQYGRGLSVQITDDYNPFIGPFYNKITKVKAFYKNKRSGRVITKTKRMGYYGTGTHFGLKKGYRVYKVKIWHRKLNKKERRNYKNRFSR